MRWPSGGHARPADECFVVLDQAGEDPYRRVDRRCRHSSRPTFSAAGSMVWVRLRCAESISQRFQLRIQSGPEPWLARRLRSPCMSSRSRVQQGRGPGPWAPLIEASLSRRPGLRARHAQSAFAGDERLPSLHGFLGSESGDHFLAHACLPFEALCQPVGNRIGWRWFL